MLEDEIYMTSYKPLEKKINLKLIMKLYATYMDFL